METPKILDVRSVDCLFVHCRALCGEETTFFARAISLLQEKGVMFLKLGPYPMPTEPDPLVRLNRFGRPVSPIVCQHSLLEPENVTWNAFGWSRGGEFAGALSNGVLDNSICLSTANPMREDFPDFHDALQDRAERFLKLFEFMLSHVKPRFGYVDNTYGNVINDKQVDNAELKKLFWVTWFGPQYLEIHSKKFFLDAPVYQAKEFEDGVLVRVTERWWDFAENDQKEVIEYFRQSFPKIRANRCVI